MTIKIPGTIFEQFHSGWKITLAHIEGAGYRAFVESPSKGIALSFIFQPENTQKLYDSLCVTHRDKTNIEDPKGKQLAVDGDSRRL